MHKIVAVARVGFHYSGAGPMTGGSDDESAGWLSPSLQQLVALVAAVRRWVILKMLIGAVDAVGDEECKGYGGWLASCRHPHKMN